jgi:hypothetical protein
MIQIDYIFPGFINQEENENFMVEIFKQELLEVLQSFQKDKRPGPYDLSVEFYLECFDFLGKYFLGVVEYSRTSGYILSAFNSTFIALIPKADNPHSFDQLRPISLSNKI